MIPMSSGVIELVMRSLAAIYLSEAIGFIGVCMAESIAWVSCAVFVFVSYHYFIKVLEKKNSIVKSI